MNQKGFINIILVLVIVALVGAGVYFVSTKQPPTSLQTTTPNPTSLTSLATSTPEPTNPISKPTSTPTSSPKTTGSNIGLKYYVEMPQNQKIGGQVGFQVFPEDKNAKVNETGPVVTFTLRKPDGSKLVSKSSLNHFAVPDCPPPPPGIPSSCGQGFWVAGGGVIFETFPYYNQAGQYTITASDSRVRGTLFEVRNLQLGSLLIDVSGYKRTRIGETIADGGANLESFIVATYQGKELFQGIVYPEVNVDVFAETSQENAKKRSEQVAKFYPRVNFEGQTIAVFENSSSYTAEWVSGKYELSVSTQQKIATTNAQDVLRAYLNKYPSSPSQ